MSAESERNEHQEREEGGVKRDGARGMKERRRNEKRRKEKSDPEVTQSRET